MHLHATERHKLTAQSARCAFLGYAINQKEFLCYDPLVRRIRISRNVVFVETQYLFQNTLDSSQPSSYSFLPNFDNRSSTFTRFKPGLVYERRGRQ